MLKPINFKNSIRGENIQSNFEFLDQRIRSEALASGGKGIIEGMEIGTINSKTISVSSGRYIDATGEEVSFPGGEYTIKGFEPVEREIKGLKVNALGQVKLPSRPYSTHFGGYFTTGHYTYLYPTNDLIIKSKETGTIIKAVKIEEDILTLDAGIWANKEVSVKYQYARNRMDTILVSKKNGVVVVTGIMSPSVSHIDLNDYEEYIVVGMVEVSIHHETALEVHYGEREERPVHVDANNNLYLNGTEYRRIFFEKPEIPKQYDVYVDYDNGNIYSYLRKDGVLDWQKVNGPLTGVLKEVKIFSPGHSDFPTDMQTFRFNEEDDLKYHFIPGLNQIEIIIDNSPLMSDQYEEIIVSNGDINNGRGFKLKAPLDKPAYVEVRVTHNTDEANENKSYQRSATFSKENIAYVGSPTDTLYEAAAPYIAGEFQLEVYYKGQKAYRDLDYFETDKEGNVVASELSTHFKFAYNLESGAEIVSRVTKNIYSYDHISKLIENSYGSIKEISEQVSSFESLLDLSLGEVEERLFQLETTDESIQEELAKMDNFVKKTDVISKEKIDASVVSGAMREPFSNMVACEAIITLEDMKTTDLIFVFKLVNGTANILLEDFEYTLSQAGDDVVLILEDEIVDLGATLLVKGVKFGI